MSRKKKQRTDKQRQTDVKQLTLVYKNLMEHIEHLTAKTVLTRERNKKGQLSMTNPRDACETFARFM